MRPASRMTTRRRQLLPLMACALLPCTAAAQSSPAASDDPPVCLGFRFDAWMPPLDWRAAGHQDPRDAVVHRAPQGRDWAATIEEGADSTLILFPSWWPAGVLVALEDRAPAPGDTVSGRATALVARGGLRAPRAGVRAWRVPCGPPLVEPDAAPSSGPGAAARLLPELTGDAGA